MGEKRNTYRLPVEEPEGKTPLGRQRRRWVDDVSMYLAETVWSDVDWIGLAQDRDRWRALGNAVMNLRVPLNAGKVSSDFTTGGSRVLLSSIELVT
jgi:hypothetical protein